MATDRNTTIFRLVKSRQNPYAQIDKGAINDARLTWKARGLLCYLLAKPDDWQTSIAHLVTAGPDGEHAVRSALKELRTYQYVHMIPVREKGRFVRWELQLFESPQLNAILPDDQEPDGENQDVVILPDSDFHHLATQPDGDFPQVDFPHVENHPPTNTDIKKEIEKDEEDAQADSQTPAPAAITVSLKPNRCSPYTAEEFSTTKPLYGDGRLHRACRYHRAESMERINEWVRDGGQGPQPQLYPAKLYTEFLFYWTNDSQEVAGHENWQDIRSFNLESKLNSWYSRDRDAFEKALAQEFPALYQRAKTKFHGKLLA